MSELPEFGYINLRGCTKNSGFVAAVAAVLGQDLPIAANTMSTGKHRIFWLGPDEWLIVVAHDVAVDLIAQLRELQGDRHMAVTDVTGGNILIRLAGDNVRDVLAKGCTLDFNADIFPVGHCAQSGLAKASVLIGHVRNEGSFEIIVRRTFSDYLALWLERASSEYGVNFTIT